MPRSTPELQRAVKFYHGTLELLLVSRAGDHWGGTRSRWWVFVSVSTRHPHTALHQDPRAHHVGLAVDEPIVLVEKLKNRGVTFPGHP